VRRVYWGLVDTGAQVSIISSGLANHLNLIAPDGSNLERSPFRVSGYNGDSTYLPIITVSM
jgi:hypothetical protein